MKSSTYVQFFGNSYILSFISIIGMCIVVPCCLVVLSLCLVLIFCALLTCSVFSFTQNIVTIIVTFIHSMFKTLVSGIKVVINDWPEYLNDDVSKEDFKEEKPTDDLQTRDKQMCTYPKCKCPIDTCIKSECVIGLDKGK